MDEVKCQYCQQAGGTIFHVCLSSWSGDLYCCLDYYYHKECIPHAVGQYLFDRLEDDEVTAFWIHVYKRRG